MHTITKEFDFAASHVLNGLAEGHKCGRLHGHNYRVVVELQSMRLDEHGFVVDYGDLAQLKEYIDGHLDHRHLNDVLDADVLTVITNPTAEWLASHLYDWIRGNTTWPVSRVGVSETPRTWAWYE